MISVELRGLKIVATEFVTKNMRNQICFKKWNSPCESRKILFSDHSQNSIPDSTHSRKIDSRRFTTLRPTAESGVRGLAEPIYTSTSEDEDHKKVIMRFQSSDDYDAEDSRDESSHAKRKVRSSGSENDSEATQSGPDSLMEDTGNSSDNLGMVSNKMSTIAIFHYNVNLNLVFFH